jgi:hypothetical protein
VDKDDVAAVPAGEPGQCRRRSTTGSARRATRRSRDHIADRVLPSVAACANAFITHDGLRKRLRRQVGSRAPGANRHSREGLLHCILLARAEPAAERSVAQGCTECPGSDVRIPLQHPLVRTSEPKGHQQAYDTGVALDLRFLRRGRRNAGRNVKSATLEGRQP